MIEVNLLRLKGMPILQQLQLEEALLRSDENNWCLINDGTSPAIVMGISGKYDELINKNLILEKPITVIRRFSGGGTVFVDTSTYFVTWIFNSESIRIPSFPDRILQWTAKFYQDVIPHADFQLNENDYTIGNKKFGGNAQYLCKQRWLHHSSLLWDFDSKNMDYLLIPKKVPAYRENRNHGEFLCKLKNYFPSKTVFEQNLISKIESCFILKNCSNCKINNYLQKTHRKSTQLI